MFLLKIGIVTLKTKKMTDRQILDALDRLPLDAYASRDNLCRAWFNPARPRPVRDYSTGSFTFYPQLN